jgi:aryl-alcohol dehydrogenase-like predicted oxidoreductase
MKVFALGESGVALSIVGLGGIVLGPDAGAEPDVSSVVRAIEAGRDAGINWVDTAEQYLATRNESLIGAALSRVDGEFFVATKVAPGGDAAAGATGFRRDQIHAACRASLRRLNREVIDWYLLHFPDRSGEVPLAESWGAMQELVEAGLVRAVGMSNYGFADVERCHAQRPVDAVEAGLSLVDFLDDRDYVAAFLQLGTPVVCFDVLGGGVLTEKRAEQVQAGWEHLLQKESLVQTGYYQRVLAPGKAERSAAVADGLRPIAARLGATVPQVALAWALHQPGVSAVLAGSRSSEHIRENAEAATLDVTDELSAIEQLIPLGPAFA